MAQNIDLNDPAIIQKLSAYRESLLPSKSVVTPPQQPNTGIDPNILNSPDVIAKLSSYRDDIAQQAQENRPAEEQQKDSLPITFTKNFDDMLSKVGEWGLQNFKAIPQGIERFDAGLIQSLLYAGTKIPTGKGESLISPQRLQNYQNDIKQFYNNQEQELPQGSLGRFVGSIAPAAALPAAKTGSWLADLAANYGMGRAFGAMQPADTPQQIASNSKTGGIVNAAIPATLQVVPSAIKSLFNKSLPEAEEVLQAGTTTGINPTVGQVTGDKSIQGLENNIKGLGLQNNLTDQDQNIESKITNLVNENQPLSDVNQAIIKHIQNKYQDVKAISDQLYQKSDEEMAKTSETIPINNLVGTINKWDQKLSKSLLEGDTSAAKGAQETLDNLKQNILQKAQNGQIAPMMLAETRSDLGSLAFNSSGKQAGMALELKNSLNSDLDAFAENGTNDVKDALNNARDFYRDNVSAIENSPYISKYLSGKPDLDKVFKSFINPNSPERLQALNPTDELQAQMAGQYLSNAFKKAHDPATGDFNVKAFLKNVNVDGSPAQSLLSPVQQEKLKGFTTLYKSINDGVKGEIKTNMGGIINSAKDMAAAITKPLWAAPLNALANTLANPNTSKLLIKAADMSPTSQAARRLVSTLNMSVIKEITKTNTIPGQEWYRFPGEAVEKAGNVITNTFQNNNNEEN